MLNRAWDICEKIFIRLLFLCTVWFFEFVDCIVPPYKIEKPKVNLLVKIQHLTSVALVKMRYIN